MADFKIKPAAGSTNKLILQAQDETDVLTTSASGVTLASATLTAPTIADLSNVTGTLPVGVTGGSGLTAVPHDVVKVFSGAFTEDAIIDIQGCFTSDYKFYKLYLGGYSCDGYIRIGYLDSSNALMTSTYYTQYVQYTVGATSGFARWSDTPTQADNSQISTYGFQPNNTWHQDSTSEGSMLEMSFYDPLNTSILHPVHWQSSWSAVEYHGWHLGAGIQNSTTAKHGLRFSMNGSNDFRATGHYTVYGYKI